MATVGNLILRIRDRCVDVTSKAYGNALLINIINEGQELYCLTSGAYQMIANFTMDGTDDFVEFTYENCNNINFLRCLIIKCDNVGLSKANIKEARDWNAVAGVPLGWHVFGSKGGDKKAYFDAIPANSKIIKVYIAGKPNDYTLIADTIELDDTGIAALAAYGEYRLRVHDKEPALGIAAYEEFKTIRDSVSILVANNMEDVD